MARIYFCGEALIDFVPGRDGVGDLTYRPKCGGSPFNAAKVAASTGGDVWFLGAISNDFFGDQLSEDLSAGGVNVDLAPRSDDPTTLAFVDMSQGTPRYAFYNNSTATQNMRVPAGIIEPKAGDILDVGSVALIDKPGADNIAQFCSNMAGQVMISVDPNVRASMINHPEAWKNRMDQILAQATIIKVSDEDLEYMAPDIEPSQFAQTMIEGGAQLVLVTYGDQGVVAYNRHHRVRVSAPTVTVSDTVGAGDALMGAMLSTVSNICADGSEALAGLSERQLQEMLQFATAAAAINCTKVGAYPPTTAEISEFLKASGASV